MDHNEGIGMTLLYRKYTSLFILRKKDRNFCIDRERERERQGDRETKIHGGRRTWTLLY